MNVAAGGAICGGVARHSDIIESMAVAGAFACLVHCTALPLLIAALPAMATVMPIPASFHLFALLFALPTTLIALWIGTRRHGRPLPLLVGCGGLALLALGVLHYGETPLEVPVTIAGTLAIATAHVANWRLRKVAG